MTKISIITPVYNGQETIERTISSVLNQGYEDIEYIIVDGKSTDDTMKIVEKYKHKIARVVSEPDKGIYDAMNKGIGLATGDIVGIVNADDYYEPGCLQKVVDCFNQTNADVIYGLLRSIDQFGNEYISGGGDADKLWYDVTILHPTVFIKKKAYSEYGSYDLEYRTSADYELLLRLFANGLHFEKIDSVISNFFLGGYSVRNFGETLDETREISFKYADKYIGNDNIARLIENRYLDHIPNIGLQEPSPLAKEVLENWVGDYKDGVIIWGINNNAKRIFDILTVFDIPVKAFADRNKDKQSELFEGTIVIDPSDIPKGEKRVFLTMNKIPDEFTEIMNKSRFNQCPYCAFYKFEEQFRVLYLQKKYLV